MERNAEINVSDRGEGRAIVLLHGFTESLEIWDNFSATLSQQFRVIAIDLPGHGGSGDFSKVHSMEFMAEAVKSVLDSLEIDSCTLVGHSLGGYVSLAFAKKFPECVNGLCLFHSHAMADSEEVKVNRERTIKIVEQNRKDFIFNFVSDLFAEASKTKFAEEIKALQLRAQQTSENGVCAALRGMKARESSLELLTKIEVPVLFIAGKEDSRIPVQKILAQVALPKHGELILLENVGHMGYIEAEKITCEALAAFALRCNLLLDFGAE